MSTVDVETTLPIQIVNQRPLQARIKEFFTTNQLSQFLSQENMLSEVEHLRTPLGPRPRRVDPRAPVLKFVMCTPRTTASLSHSHARSQNIGLILHLSTYARVNEFGVIETPYVKVENGKVTKK